MCLITEDRQTDRQIDRQTDRAATCCSMHNSTFVNMLTIFIKSEKCYNNASLNPALPTMLHQRQRQRGREGGGAERREGEREVRGDSFVIYRESSVCRGLLSAPGLCLLHALLLAALVIHKPAQQHQDRSDHTPNDHRHFLYRHRMLVTPPPSPPIVL